MFFKKIVLVVSLFAFLAPTFAGTIPGYVTDSSGKLVRSKVTGECVKTGTWEAKNLIPECDKAKPAAPAPTPAPAPAPTPAETVTVKPLAEPAVIAAEPLVLKKSETLTLSAWVLFGFDKSTLTAKGEEALDAVVVALKNVEHKTIKLDGYTDRIGTDAYNITLSYKRANAVRVYLVAHGVDVSKIKVTGHGKSKFRTTNTDCKGQKGAKLKACYGPDRRVELTLE